MKVLVGMKGKTGKYVDILSYISIFMIKKYSLIILLVSIFSCSVMQKDLSQIESNYSIDLDGEKEISIPLSIYFKSPKSIILETRKECLIGRIDKFYVFNGYIYAFDMNIAKSLFVFDLAGRFIRKIGNIGQGPGEFIHLLDFTLDTENKFIFLLDYGQRIHKYHLDGTFIRTITPKVQNTNINFIQYYKGKLFLSVTAYKPSTDNFLLLEADPDDGKILKRTLPVKLNKGWGLQIRSDHSFFISRLNKPPLYNQLFMDYIVSIGEEITPYISFKSKNLSTERDIEKLHEVASNTKNAARGFMDFSKIWDANIIVENDDFFLLGFQHGFGNQNYVIKHKKTDEVKLTNYLNNDLIFKQDQKGWFGKFSFFDSHGAYSVLQDILIGTLQESIRNNEITQGLEIVDELLKLADDSNPVILYYEYK